MTKKDFAELEKTRWSLFKVANTGGMGADHARNKLTEHYYPAVVAYVRCLLRNRSAAAEVAQDFFVEVFLPGRLLRAADPARGRFRQLLKTAIFRYVVDSTRKVQRTLRFELPLDDEDRLHQLTDDANCAFDEEWARSLVSRVMERVEAICIAKTQHRHLEIFKGWHLGEPRPSWRELGDPDLDEKAARNRAETVAEHFRTALRTILFEELGDEALVEAELSDLILKL
jgi:DNA-directed RNA polymerase specialized sigma24 family protein